MTRIITSCSPRLSVRYRAQVDVLKQLGDKLERQLQVQESQLESLPRTEASKKRATHIKLAKDFRRVEATFKNVQLETRRKRARLQEERAQAGQQSLVEQDDELQRQLVQEDVRRCTINIHESFSLVVHSPYLFVTKRVHEEIMREREEEIRNINRGMHQVNEIYKDLAHIVGSQQEQIDTIETQMEDSKANAEKGLAHVVKANEKASSCVIS